MVPCPSKNKNWEDLGRKYRGGRWTRWDGRFKNFDGMQNIGTLKLKKRDRVNET